MASARCQLGMLRAGLRAHTRSLASSCLRHNSTSAVAESSSTATASASAAAANSDTFQARGQSSTASNVAQAMPQAAKELAAEHGLTPVQYSYYVPRVGRLADSLPVYTDVRNGGSRIMTEVRRVEGNLHDLRTDLTNYLAETYSQDTPSAVAAQATLMARALAQEQNATEPHIEYLPFNGRTPQRIKPPRRAVKTKGNPSAIDPIQTSVVVQSGKLKIRGNRVRQVKQFLEAKGF